MDLSRQEDLEILRFFSLFVNRTLIRIRDSEGKTPSEQRRLKEKTLEDLRRTVQGIQAWRAKTRRYDSASFHVAVRELWALLEETFGSG